MTSNISSRYDSKFLHKKVLFESTSRETIDLLQRSLRNIREIMNVGECSLTLLEPVEAALFIYSTEQKLGEEPGRVPLHKDEEVANWITQQTATILDAKAQAAASPTIPSSTDGSARSIILTENDTLLGILRVRSSKALDDREVRMLSVLADQITMTISKMIQISGERQEMERTKAHFFSTIAHDLRSPLNSINGYLELAMSGAGGELNEQQYEFIQRARAGSELLYALLENLLLISRADNGQMKLNRELVNLRDVIDNAVEEWELSQRDQDVILTVHTSPDIHKIYADPIRLQQVLRNLISNALNFTPSGGEIIIRALLAEDREDAQQFSDRQEDEKMGILKLQVRDTGIGIAPEHHTRIFERYFQAPNEFRGRAGGPGLGLAIVKLIVELHGGSVFVESSPHQGSTFTCLLPCILR